MARQPTEVTTAQPAGETAPAPVPMTQGALTANLDAAALAMMEEAAPTNDAGRADLLTPYLTIVQNTSPYMQRNNPLFIADARAGDIIDTLHYILRDRARVIPCRFEVHYTEWKPNQGGLVAQYFTDPTKYNACGSDFGARRTSEGNEIVPSAVFYDLLVGDDGSAQAVVHSLTGTQYKKARRLNTLIASLELRNSRGEPFIPPCYARSYILTTVPESNELGSWMGWQIDPAELTLSLPHGRALFERAKAFRESIERGEVRAQAPIAAAANDPQPSTATARGGGRPDDDIPF